MATLKYWDMTTSTWLPLTGNPIVPSYKPVSYTSKIDTSINVSATAYGISTGPSLNCTISGFAAAIFFYAQTGLAVGGPTSDLAVSYGAVPDAGVVGGTTIAPSDDNCLYLTTPAAGHTGPGSVSGVMLCGSLVPGNWTFTIHNRVTLGTTSMMRRRMVVLPMNLAEW